MAATIFSFVDCGWRFERIDLNRGGLSYDEADTVTVDDGPGAGESGEAALDSETPFTSTPYTEAVLSVSSSTNLPPLLAIDK